jgi:HAD superfamily hydrolase (TIGR01509 family)
MERKSTYIASMISPAIRPTLRPFSAIVFDLDGTLLDTELVFKDIVYGVCEGLGFEMTADIHLAMVGTSHEASSRLLAEAYGVSFPYALFDQHCRTRMQERMAEMVPVKTGVHELLDELAARRIPAAVATSSGANHALKHLGTAGLLDRFVTIVTRDDVTDPKPHPEPYLTAAARLRIDPADCLAVEDSRAAASHRRPGDDQLEDRARRIKPVARAIQPSPAGDGSAAFDAMSDGHG